MSKRAVGGVDPFYVAGAVGLYATTMLGLEAFIKLRQSGRENALAIEQRINGLRGELTAANKRSVKEARARGERIVFTNGCFDVLHAMHVEYLQLARKQGDRLIVAVNDDASITRLKGPGRPVNKAEHRMAVLAGLQAVDWVVQMHDDTPNRLLALIRPDVLAKGGDYGLEGVVGADIVQSYGGEVVVLGGVADGVKSTAIIERMKALNKTEHETGGV